MNYSVVIPVYRGADTLDPLVERLAQVMPGVADKFEVVLVNDGSPDNSWDVVKRLAEKFSWVRGINLMRNYGQHNAVLCGIRQARYEIIITMDDDLQHPPEEIPVLLAKLNEGFDVVYGVPKKLPQSWWRNTFSVITKYAISYVMGLQTVREIGSFRALRTSLRDAFTTYTGPDVLEDVLFSWGTTRFASVEVNEDQRTIGQSNYTFIKLVRVALLVLTSYTTLPLRLASVIGFLFTLFGFGVLIYVLVTYFVAGSVPGFSFQASLVAIFSGVQLFALGIIGEYLARLFERTSGRPAYTVAETTRSTEQK